MPAGLGDVPGQPAGDAEHRDGTRSQNDQDDPGEDIESGHRDPSTGWLRLGELPFSVQDFSTRAIEPYCVVPAFGDRQAVRHLAVATAKLDVDDATAFR